MIDLNAKHRMIVDDIILRLLPANTCLYAFGSRVCGTAKPHSDLDLVIKGASRIEKRIMRELALAFDDSDLPFRVDIIDWASITENFRAIIAPQIVPLAAALHPEKSPSCTD